MTRKEYEVQRALNTLPPACKYFIHSACDSFIRMDECFEDEDAVYCPICLGIITIKG